MANCRTAGAVETVSPKGGETVELLPSSQRRVMALATQDERIAALEATLIAIYRQREDLLKGYLGTKVSIVPKENGAGKIEIEFFSHEELDRLTDLLK